MQKTISDDYGIVLLADRETNRKLDLAGEATWRKPLEAAARVGDVFFIDREDPIVGLRAELVTEPVTEETHPRFLQRAVGNFLLRAPSGRLRLTGLGQWQAGADDEAGLDVEPGDYNVVVYSHEDADIDRYHEDVVDVIGEADDRYVRSVQRLYFVGCLPTLTAIGVMVFAPWQVGAAAGVLAVLLWLPYLLGVRTARYRSASNKIEAFDAGLPLFVMQLNRVESPEGLVGGYLR